MGAKLFVMPDFSIEDMIQTIKNSGYAVAILGFWLCASLFISIRYAMKWKDVWFTERIKRRIMSTFF